MIGVISIHLENPETIKTGKGPEARRCKEYLKQLSRLLESFLDQELEVVFENEEFEIHLSHDDEELPHQITILKKSNGQKVFRSSFDDEEVEKVAQMVGVFGVNQKLIVKGMEEKGLPC